MSAKLLDTAKMMGRTSVRVMAGVVGVKSVLDLIAAAASDPFDRCKPIEGQLNLLRQRRQNLADHLIQDQHDPKPGKPDPEVEREFQALNHEIAAKESELSACLNDVEPVSHVVANDFAIYSDAMFENTAQVVTPHQDCPNGRIILHTGQDRGTCGFVVRDLLDNSGAISSTPASPPAFAYPFDANQTNATDNQIIRLQDGTLLASKNGYIFSDLPTRPQWFDSFDITFNGRSGVQTSQRARNAVFIFHSTDRGLTWKLRSQIDAAVVADGKYGWPQIKKEDGVVSVGVGGYDRTELYQDPWTGHVYVAGHGDAGYKEGKPMLLPNGMLYQAHASAIFRSKNDGKTWETLHVFPENGAGWTSFMTSTPNHPLVALRDNGDAPTLWYLKKGSEKLEGGHQVLARSHGDPISMGTLVDDDFTPPNGGGQRIARMSWDGARDRVWVAYPTFSPPSLRQKYVLCSVEFGGNNDPKVELIRVIEAEASDESCTHGAFVQDDFVEWNPSASRNFTMFYWLERSLDATKPARMRYKVLYGNGEELPAEHLSVAGGARRTFNMTSLGHYMAGGFYYWGGAVNFLGQWVEPSEIRGNVVSVRPKKPR